MKKPMADQLLTAAQGERGSIDIELAHEIASAMIARRVDRGWSRQTILASIEFGHTPCRRGFYMMKAGGIAIGPFALTCFSEISGRGACFSIRDLLPPLPDRTHEGVEELQPFEVGDKVWSWYRDEPNANYGLPDLPGDASNWRRRPRLFTVRNVTGPHTQRGFCAGRPHYTVRLRYQEGPPADHYTAGNHDVCPIAGRPWQMRAEGEYLQLAQRAAPRTRLRRAKAKKLPVASMPAPPALSAQMDLFA